MSYLWQHSKFFFSCYFRETPDIFYYDICAPFIADKMEIRANNLKSDDSNYSLLGIVRRFFNIILNIYNMLFLKIIC
jgi:hypothetical protein